MRFRTFVILAVLVLITSSLSTMTTGAGQHKSPAHQNEDLISGDWDTFLIPGGSGDEIPLTLKLKLDRDKVTGTFESDHLGLGDVKEGSWTANKLTPSFEMSHGLIKLTGELKQGKLTGKFDAGHTQGTWQAKKKN
jgi:hypothetical protein